MVEVKEYSYVEALLKQLHFFRNLDPTQNLHRFLFSLLTFIVDLTFGNILNIWDGKSVVVGEIPI